ncbi:amino acid permease-associated region, partial [mine drainage metagenome]
KLVLYVLVAIGLLSMGHFGNFSNYGGFAPFGFNGMFLAIPLAMFAFGGIRVIPDYSEEANQDSHVGRSIMWTVFGQSIIYLLLAIAFVAGLNWAADGLKVGAWTSVSSLPGNPFLVLAQHGSISWLVIATVIIAIIGPFVTGYIYQVPVRGCCSPWGAAASSQRRCVKSRRTTRSPSGP